MFWSMVLDVMVFRSMVLDASACINMYCNIERNIMKNQAGSPSFGIQWEISVYMCFMCYALAFFIFLCFRILMQVISIWGSNLHLVSKLFWFQEDAFFAEGFRSGLW